MKRALYTAAFVVAGAVGLATTVVAVAGLVLLGVAKRAETQLAHLEDWMPAEWFEATP